jgi:hypothetical protein
VQRLGSGPAKTQSGYPGAVELPGGRVFVAYYASSGPQHQRYHMGLINLTFDEIR